MQRDRKILHTASLAALLTGIAAQNGWAAEQLDNTERLALGYIFDLVQTKLPILLFGAAILFATLVTAATLPEVLGWMIAQTGVRERYTRFVSVPLFIGVVLVGLSLAAAVADLDIGHAFVLLGIAGLAFSYGFGAPTGNIAGWLLLPFFPPVELGRTITVPTPSGAVTGVVMQITMCFVVLEVEKRTTWVPNRYFQEYGCTDHAPGEKPDWNIGRSKLH